MKTDFKHLWDHRQNKSPNGENAEMEAVTKEPREQAQENNYQSTTPFKGTAISQNNQSCP